MAATGTRARIAALAAIVALLVPAAAQADEIDDFQGTWIDRALDAQYELSSDVPFVNAPWVGTHNSFNSTAEMGPTLSAQDSNQKITLVDQLEINMRSLELDLHRFPSAGGGGGFVPVVCHALSGGGGCTVEKSFDVVLAEIEAWLRANPGQVILLYLEDDLQDEPTHDKASVMLEESIGDLIYEPPQDSGCTELPWTTLTREAVRAAGKQVVVVANCGVGTAWQNLIHSWNEHAEERPFGYEDFPACGGEVRFTRAEYDSRLIRYYEDSTQLTATAGNPDDGITPATAAAMARCGVDLIGFDQLTPFDGRLAGSVWSWARHHPIRSGNRRCALIRVGPGRAFGRWLSRNCREVRRRPACRTATGGWRLPGRNAGFIAAKRRCERRGLQLAVPRTGPENQALRLKMERKGVKSAWLGYRLRRGSWRALDER